MRSVFISEPTYERGKNLANCKFCEDKDFVWALHPEIPKLSDSPHLAAQRPASWSMAAWALWRVLCTGPKKYKLQTSLASEILPSVTQAFSMPSWQSFQFQWYKKRKKRERRERKKEERKGKNKVRSTPQLGVSSNEDFDVRTIQWPQVRGAFFILKVRDQLVVLSP